MKKLLLMGSMLLIALFLMGCAQNSNCPHIESLDPKLQKMTIEMFEYSLQTEGAIYDAFKSKYYVFFWGVDDFPVDGFILKRPKEIVLKIEHGYGIPDLEVQGIPCFPGEDVGENPNYLYCKYLIAEKKIYDKDGYLTEDIKSLITVVFNENKKYKEIVCNPDKI